MLLGGSFKDTSFKKMMRTIKLGKELSESTDSRSSMLLPPESSNQSVMSSSIPSEERFCRRFF